jgi:hypothetical protein
MNTIMILMTFTSSGAWMHLRPITRLVSLIDLSDPLILQRKVRPASRVTAIDLVGHTENLLREPPEECCHPYASL